jgi:hypothetical protein
MTGTIEVLTRKPYGALIYAILSNRIILRILLELHARVGMFDGGHRITNVHFRGGELSQDLGGLRNDAYSRA